MLTIIPFLTQIVYSKEKARDMREPPKRVLPKEAVWFLPFSWDAAPAWFVGTRQPVFCVFFSSTSGLSGYTYSAGAVLGFPEQSLTCPRFVP